MNDTVQSDDPEERERADQLAAEGLRRCPWCGGWVLENTDTPRPPAYCHHDTFNP